MKDEARYAVILWHFQREVKRQCDFATLSFQEIDEAVQSYRNVLGHYPFEGTNIQASSTDSERYYEELLEEHKKEDENETLLNEYGSQVWLRIQSMLVALGNISKLLWPNSSDNEVTKFRRSLRKSLNVKKESHLKDRKFRNHFEHFDERLDKWSSRAKGISFTFTDSVIGEGDIYVMSPGSVFRHYDPRNDILMFHKDKYELQPIRKELRALNKIATRKASSSPFE